MEEFKKAIKDFLDNKASCDALFSVTYAKENKSLDECIAYIASEISKMEQVKIGNGISVSPVKDEVVFNLAVHYYDEDDLKVEPFPKGSFNVTTSSPEIELTEQEKEIARQRAIRRFEQEEIAKAQKIAEETKKKKVADRAAKESEFEKRQMSLF